MKSNSTVAANCSSLLKTVFAAWQAWLFLLFVLISIYNNVFGQSRQQFYTLSTIWARPMGMGGAFMAVEDNLAALVYNPANFALYREPRTHRFTVFFNPIGAVAALYRPEHLYGRRELRVNEIATALELLIRGIAFSHNPFEFAALIGEESPLPAFADRPDFLNTQHYGANQYSLLAGRARFAERVSIGGTVGIYYANSANGRRWGVGWSYGVTLLSSSNIRIGVSYWSFPSDMAEYRLQPERLVDDAINLGVAYKTPFGLLMALDIRNLGEEARSPVREIHVGLEQNFFSWIVLRGGYFRDRIDRYNIVTAGVGLINQNLWRPPRLQLQEPDWALNYAVMFEKQGLEKTYYHALTFLIRL